MFDSHATQDKTGRTVYVRRGRPPAAPHLPHVQTCSSPIPCFTRLLWVITDLPNPFLRRPQTRWPPSPVPLPVPSNYQGKSRRIFLCFRPNILLSQSGSHVAIIMYQPSSSGKSAENTKYEHIYNHAQYFSPGNIWNCKVDF